MWGHAHLLGTGWMGQLRQVRRAIGDAVLGYHRVSAYQLSPSIAAAYARQLIRSRPTGLIGYASAVDLFGRYTQAFRPQFRALGLRFVLLTSEPPPRPDTTEMLEDLFGCTVVQEYGGAEFGQVAFKTGRERFRVYRDLNVVEAQPPLDGEPDAHPLLLTALYPRYLPLIRYRCGDTATGIHRWSNGHVDSFDAIGGRMNYVVQLSEGDGVHTLSIQHCVMGEAAVHNLQMVISDDGIELALVTSDPDRVSLESRIRQRLADVHPRLAGVSFRYVEDVATNRAGKRRWFVDQRSAPPCAASPAS
jgi:phenylacetate-coenzyme A ligase PaaK-like adenylate-forming protein